MNILLVYYELRTMMSYKAFYALLEAYDHCWVYGNRCLVRTNNNEEDVRKILYDAMGENDLLTVCKFRGELTGIRNEAKEWLQVKLGKVY